MERDARILADGKLNEPAVRLAARRAICTLRHTRSSTATRQRGDVPFCLCCMASPSVLVARSGCHNMRRT